MISCLLNDLTRVYDDRYHFHPCHPSNQGWERRFFIPRVLEKRIALEQCSYIRWGEQRKWGKAISKWVSLPHVKTSFILFNASFWSTFDDPAERCDDSKRQERTESNSIVTTSPVEAALCYSCYKLDWERKEEKGREREEKRKIEAGTFLVKLMTRSSWLGPRYAEHLIKSGLLIQVLHPLHSFIHSLIHSFILHSLTSHRSHCSPSKTTEC